jgi:hypothetical protein
MRGLAFRSAGILWLLLGIAAILTIFGTLIGIALALLVGVRRSVTAARVGACLGLLLLLPGQLILDLAGCDHQPCGAQPYLLAYALPALVVTLNGIAGWVPGARAGAAAAKAGSVPARSAGEPDGGDRGKPVDRRERVPEVQSEPEIAPGQQSLWG